MLCRDLNEILKKRYDIDLMESIDHDHIIDIFDHYSSKKDILRQIFGESVINDSSEYSKSYLISETAIMILREIAPKRTKKKKKGVK